MTKKTYIIGHLKPDTDSIVAAMALEHLYKSKSCFGYDNPQAVRSDKLNPETIYIFNRFDVAPPRLITNEDINDEDQIVLVDHNEASQRLIGLNQDKIVDIVDHHKINCNLSKPIFMTIKAWGSSATIVYFLLKNNQVSIDKKLASIMLAAIISDTVGFKSSTTTTKDKESAEELAKIAEINDLDTFALDIFKAKSDLSKLSAKEIVKNDFKVYEFSKKVFIGQVETVDQEDLLKTKKQELLQAMQEVKDEEKVDYLFLAISDVLKVNSKIICLSDSEKEVLEKSFEVGVEDSVINIGAKLSRKKEIAPAIEKVLK